MASSVYKWLKSSSLALLLLMVFGFSKQAPLAVPLADLMHPLYISVTEMEYNPKEQALEISCKVFTDDLEKGLGKANDAKVDMYNPKDKVLLEK